MPDPIAFTESKTLALDELVNGDFPRVQLPVTIASGSNLKRGAPLGRITASGKYIVSTPAAIDGSQVPRAILAEDVDASAADKVGPAFFSGQFDPTKLDFTGSTFTAATIVDEYILAGAAIYLRASL